MVFVHGVIRVHPFRYSQHVKFIIIEHQILSLPSPLEMVLLLHRQCHVQYRNFHLIRHVYPHVAHRLV